MEVFIRHQDKNKRKEEAVNFFIEHKTNSYISHSEIMSGRAKSTTEWSENFADILSAELDEDDCNLITIEDIHNKIIGIAILRIYRKYLIIEDMIVDGSLRGMSLGKKLMDFIHNFAAEQKIKALFLESGINNDKAHSFFEKNGFEKVSVTYIKTLPDN
ncbi:GNAT family N-acetyltransferase [Elizabethkingia bruuniana]|uniref:GNAT family N-acetyltransferase n=1 Tax=Elizabethkingia bruuniana TaxID=1756149 RepID=UPI000999286D|nr:GNAT family N-acetyltransferase [Elizabethkingia bruuniana]OPC56812.1 acetyltransferase [Elizabethkingia bruuniana]